ncbi:MAG TPA: hypothetical protein VGO89_05630 [Streptomyces sp.]|nr:hypothetical protein [Streptomyces sp.]
MRNAVATSALAAVSALGGAACGGGEQQKPHRSPTTPTTPSPRRTRR